MVEVEPIAAIGLDAAWSDRNPSAVCLVDDGGMVRDEAELGSDAEIVGWIAARMGARTVVAADLPLLVPNPAGMRPCDRAVMRAYGARGAGPHPANRSLLEGRDGRIRGEDLAAVLADHGFAGPWDDAAHTLLEVYPHPGLVEVFGLASRHRYKKGTVAERRRGLQELVRMLASLASHVPPLHGGSVPDPASLRGRALKSLEDRLDARFCAYVGVLWARDRSRIRVFGDRETGHIAVPVGPRDPG